MGTEIPPNEMPRGEPEPPRDNGSPSTTTLALGLVLIAVGGLFLLQTLGLFGGGIVLRNWWALFFLIPIAGAAANLWRTLQANDGRFDASVSGQLVGLLLLIFLMAMFLFGFNWGRLWPVFLIIAGLGALASALAR